MAVVPGVERVIRGDQPSWIPVFAGVSEQQFRALVGLLADRGGAQYGAGR